MFNLRHRRRLDTVLWIAAAAIAGALATDAAHARDRFDLANPAYVAECGSCHVAYPPQLLSAGGWQSIMAALDKHFGDNAALDGKTTVALTQYLTANAGRGDKLGEAQRISQTAWFTREHRRVPAATWGAAPVKSPANCQACHAGADRGNYDEHAVRVPAAAATR
jgi:hypothetical protein